MLVGNELAEPGERTVYVQIIGPDGYVLANASNALFDFEGDKITFRPPVRSTIRTTI